VLSEGLLIPAPFAHAAFRLRQRRLWLITAAYTVAAVVAIIGLATSPETGTVTDIWGFSLLALTITASGHAFVLSRRVFPEPPVPPPTTRT